MKNYARAFTLIELLAAIAIISILTAILLPAFAQAREKSRQATCQANIRCLMGAVFMYAQDNDSDMPLSWNVMAQVGPGLSADSGGKLQERGLQVDILPYVKSVGNFYCPDDKGIQIDPNNVTATYATVPFVATDGVTTPDPQAVSEPFGSSAARIFGVSYKFTKENFTLVNGVGGQSFTCVGSATICLGPATGSKPSVCANYTTPPPNPMPIGFYARPAETRVLRDFLSVPGNTEKWAQASTYWHPFGEIIGFADGHAGLVNSPAMENTFCDGPTRSPNYDGSCNTVGAERFK